MNFEADLFSSYQNFSVLTVLRVLLLFKTESKFYEAKNLNNDSNGAIPLPLQLQSCPEKDQIKMNSILPSRFANVVFAPVITGKKGRSLRRTSCRKS